MRIDEKILALIDKYGASANSIFDESFAFDDLNEFIERDYSNTYCRHNEYIENDEDFEKIAELSFQLKEELKGNTYFDDGETYLELRDSHTLWKITEDIDIGDYSIIVNDYFKQFERMAETEIYALGRSGRHLCVDYTIQNAVRFGELCTIQGALEDELISEINSGKFRDY